MLLKLFKPALTKRLFTLPIYSLTTKRFFNQHAFLSYPFSSRMTFSSIRYMSKNNKESSSDSESDEKMENIKYESNEQLEDEIELYNSKKVPVVMHRIIKKMCNSEMEVDGNLKKSVKGLSNFCSEVSERILTSRNINPGFLDDCTDFFLYYYGASEEAITKLVMSVYEHFDKCNFEALCNIFYFISTSDPEMKNDLTMLFAYRFLEFMIEYETTNKLSYNTMVTCAEGFINFKIANPLAESVYERMLIKYFDSGTDEFPNFESTIVCLQLINLSPNTVKLRSNECLWALAHEHMKNDKPSIVDLYNLSTIIKLVPSNHEILCKQIIECMAMHNIDSEMICEKLNSDHAVEFINTILSNVSKIEDTKFLECATNILKNSKNTDLCLAYDTYRTIRKCKHFEEKETKFLSMIFYEHIQKQRELTYYKEYKSSEAFSKRRINRTNTTAFKKMFNVSQGFIVNEDNNFGM